MTGLFDDDAKRREDLARYAENRKRAEHERNARRFTEHQRAQGVGNANRGGRSCSVVLLLMVAATAGLADAIRSVIT